MRIFIDKSLVLNRIKEAYHLTGNSELARFLGVAPNTITNWYSRNSIDYDLVFTKCEELDMNWLLTGKNEMLKVDTNRSDMNEVDSMPTVFEHKAQYNAKEHILLLKETIIDKDKIIEEKTQTIQALTDAIRVLMSSEKSNSDIKGGHMVG